METISDAREGFPELLIKKLTITNPLTTDFGNGDDYTVEGSLSILDIGVVTLKDILSIPQSIYAGEMHNDLIEQQEKGNLVLYADKGILKIDFKTNLPHEEALLIDPKLPPCYDEVPYSFKYIGEAHLSANLKVLKSSTGKFAELKCIKNGDVK